jgi:hypothetical protein
VKSIYDKQEKYNKLVKIIGFDNQKGLSKDIGLISRELSDIGADFVFLDVGEKIDVSTNSKIYNLSKAILKPRFLHPRKHEISIFLEQVVPELLGQSKVNLLIPNPEWFHPSWQLLSGKFDSALCKTNHSNNIYRSLGFKTQYIGFTSPNKQQGELRVDKRHEFLHIAGGSHFKGTAQLVDVWEKHPEWPKLTVVTHRVLASYTSPASNVHIVSKFMDELTLTQLQNETLFHIYPSQAEGFGHCINEAMSCGAIVLSNNAVPMNELLTTTEGFLFDCRITDKKCLSPLVEFDTDSFEKQINTAIREPLDKQWSRCMQARKVYEDRDRCFRANFRSIILKYLAV